jgi:hypothetical protein
LNGRQVWKIAKEMNLALDGRELFSDSPFDEAWLQRIFAAAGLEPTFTIRRMDAEILISELAVNRGMDAAAYSQAKSKAEQLVPRTHRAEADARHLAVLQKTIADWTP